MKTKSKVIFAGAGPGAADLLTLRCLDALKKADVIIHAGSLVNPELLGFARKKALRLDSASMTLEEIVCEIRRAAGKGQSVLRLHTGDPSVYGAIAEQMRELDKLGIGYEVIPGVSSVFAAAAALKTELTAPEVSQTLIITRRAGRTPVPEGQDIAKLAESRSTMAVFLSAGEISGLVKELVEGGYAEKTPAAVVYRASWKDEKIVRGNLSNIAGRTAKAGIRRQFIVFIGDALGRKAGKASLLYSASFEHGYRGRRQTG